MDSSLVSKVALLVGSNRTSTGFLAALPLLYILYRAKALPAGSSRQKKVPCAAERVVVLGASSGIGRSIARQYAERGAQVAIVGRRGALVDEVTDECWKARLEGGYARPGKGHDLLGFTGDFTSVEDMVRLRDVLGNGESLGVRSITSDAEIDVEWDGFDTLIVAAGVSALQPLLSIAGYEAGATQLTTAEGIHKAKAIALKAIEGNYVGPLVAAVTFVRVGSLHYEHLIVLTSPPLQDPSPQLVLAFTFDTPRQLSRIGYPGPNAYSIRLDKISIPPALSGPLNRAPQYRLLPHYTLDGGRRLSCLRCRFWTCPGEGSQ
jgi:short chain dehydrogenase